MVRQKNTSTDSLAGRGTIKRNTRGSTVIQGYTIVFLTICAHTWLSSLSHLLFKIKYRLYALVCMCTCASFVTLRTRGAIISVSLISCVIVLIFWQYVFATALLLYVLTRDARHCWLSPSFSPSHRIFCEEVCVCVWAPSTCKRDTNTQCSHCHFFAICVSVYLWSEHWRHNTQILLHTYRHRASAPPYI